MLNWMEIWNNKNVRDFVIKKDSPEKTFMGLKNAMGVNKIGGGEISYKDFFDQFVINYREMTFSAEEQYIPKSFFDVGCGTGGYLYLLSEMKKGYELGGIDYSEPFIRIASKVLGGRVKELSCGEAIHINTDVTYDHVFSRSIFQYFVDQNYAEIVINKMIDKAKHSVGIFDIHDFAKKNAFIAYRKSTIEDYEKKYDDSSHMFYDKEFFLKIAEKRNCGIKFSKAIIQNYWNAPFTYDVYFYKNENE